MKILLPLLFTFVCTLPGFSQIPNGSFEDWETLPGYEKPVAWNTNQTPPHKRFEKDTSSVTGDYSLKIIPSSQTAWTNCMSEADVEFELDGQLGDNKSLYFFVKSHIDNDDDVVFAEVRLICWRNNQLLGELEWKNFDPINDFKQIELPIPYPAATKMQVLIFGGARNGPADGCFHQSITWLDDLKIDDSTISSTKPPAELDISVFPNPASGTIHLTGNVSDISFYQLFDSQGRKIRQKTLTQPTITLEKEGMFFLVLMTKQGQSTVFTLENLRP